MIARVFHAFGSGVCESIPVQLVNDVFFLHERGKRIGYYTGKRSKTLLMVFQADGLFLVCLCLGSTGPLYAGYMLAGGYSWRLFFYVETAFAAALLILAFFFVEESMYDRPEPRQSPSETVIETDEKLQETQYENVTPAIIPKRKSFLSTLKPWSRIDRNAPFFTTMLRSFTYFFVPAVFWVITSFGMDFRLANIFFFF